MCIRDSPDSDEANANVAEVLETVPEGPLVIVVVGATVSTVQERAAGLPTLPAASVARTPNVCTPCARPL